MKVDDDIERLITRPAVMVDGQTTIRRAAALLTDESIGVLVIQGTHPPALVSERDVVTALADGMDPDLEHVEVIATLDVAVAGPHDSIAEVGRLMLDDEIRHVPIVDGHAVAGVASMRDVLSAALGLNPE
jgi:signal-transduction protein with cAMP-binding, CBS, and nucleotidyltransferase domain